MSQPRGRRGGSTGAESGRGSGRTETAAPPPYRPVTPEQRERLRELVEPIVTAAGYDLEDLSVSRAGRRHLVSIAVDSDSGVDLDAVAVLARTISHDIDAAEAGGEELIPGEFELEVGSRGVDRPLTEPRHWRRNTGRLVTVPVGPQPATEQLTGRVTAVDDAGVTLAVEDRGKPGTKRRPPTPRLVLWSELGPGRVQVEFGRHEERDGGPETGDHGHLDHGETDGAGDDGGGE
jgi:ribosome maturation factor RimP